MHSTDPSPRRTSTHRNVPTTLRAPGPPPLPLLSVGFRTITVTPSFSPSTGARSLGPEPSVRGCPGHCEVISSIPAPHTRSQEHPKLNNHRHHPVTRGLTNTALNRNNITLWRRGISGDVRTRLQRLKLFKGLAVAWESGVSGWA